MAILEGIAINRWGGAAVASAAFVMLGSGAGPGRG
jgi:hypothetical protein